MGRADRLENLKSMSEADERANLIHSVYQIALEPQSYDVFMDHWDGHVGKAIEELSALQGSTDLDDPEILGHFNTAFGILEELGRRPQEPLREGTGPRFLIDRQGAVVWRNPAAARLLGLSTRSRIEHIAPFMHEPPIVQRLCAELDRLDDSHKRLNRLLRADLEEGPLFLLARSIVDRDGQRLILVEPLLGEWSNEVDLLLKETFALTEAEAAVAAGLADGYSPAQLAGRRRVSILTVRTQIKSLLAKTGAANQTDLMRILMSASRALDRSAGEDDQPEPTLELNRDGRQIQVVQAGLTGGQPVIFLHGMLDGPSTTPRIQRALQLHRLHLLCPLRPGFGSAPADVGPIGTAPQRVAEDVEFVMDSLGLKRVILLGHMAGALYAFAAAARLGPRVAGIVCVAGTVPIVSTGQFSTMSRRQRLVAYTARYAPSALPFVLRAGIRQLDFDGERNFMTALYENSPHDLGLIEDSDIYRSLRRGYRFTVEQGHKAFETDGYHVVRDWSSLAAASHAPVHFIHGRHDPVVNAQSVEEFAKRLGERARATMLEDHGQLVLYKSPPIVCAAIGEMLAETVHEKGRAPREGSDL